MVIFICVGPRRSPAALSVGPRRCVCPLSDPGALCVRPRRSLCRGPELSTSGPALSVSGPALCFGCLCQGPACFVSGPGARRFLCRGPALSVSGSGASRHSGPWRLSLCVGPHHTTLFVLGPACSSDPRVRGAPPQMSACHPISGPAHTPANRWHGCETGRGPIRACHPSGPAQLRSACHPSRPVPAPTRVQPIQLHSAPIRCRATYPARRVPLTWARQSLCRGPALCFGAGVGARELSVKTFFVRS